MGLLARLQTAQAGVDEAAAGLEKRFLATGAELEKLAELGDQFVCQVEKLIGLATGRDCDHSVFRDAIQLIEETMIFLTSSEKETSGILDRLRSYDGQIAQLLGTEEELKRAMLPLNIVQTLFRMESAPLGLEVQQLFSALTQEIDGLHGQMREVFETKFKQLENTKQITGAVVGKLERQVESLRETTTSRQAQIQASIETLKNEMNNNEQRDVRLGRFSRDLSKEVQEVVTGLQFQDIVNQKLQHVRGVLPQISGRISQARAQCPAVGDALFIRQSCRLEAAQLELAQQELAAAETNISGGVGRVQSHLAEMDSRCLSLEEFKLLTTSFDGIVQVLVETLEEVRGVVAVTVGHAAEAYELLRPLGSLASDLTLVIRDMSGQIKLIGLNAQIKAAQASQDRRTTGLEVLSARTCEISEETNRIGQQAATRLDSLVDGMMQSVKAFEALQGRGQAQQARLDGMGRKQEAELHAIRDQALATLREIGISLKDVEQQAQRALDSVAFAEFHEVTLPALREPLVAIGDAMDKLVAGQPQNGHETTLMEDLKRDYTMASERHIFAGVMAGAGTGTAVSTAPAADEVELFDVKPESPAGESGDLKKTEETTSETATIEAAPPSDLGANVELF